MKSSERLQPRVGELRDRKYANETIDNEPPRLKQEFTKRTPAGNARRVKRRCMKELLAKCHRAKGGDAD